MCLLVSSLNGRKKFMDRCSRRRRRRRRRKRWTVTQQQDPFTSSTHQPHYWYFWESSNGFLRIQIRLKIKDGFPVFENMKLGVEAYDHFLLAKLLSSDAKQHTTKYLENISYLKLIRLNKHVMLTMHFWKFGIFLTIDL